MYREENNNGNKKNNYETYNNSRGYQAGYSRDAGETSDTQDGTYRFRKSDLYNNGDDAIYGSSRSNPSGDQASSASGTSESNRTASDAGTFSFEDDSSRRSEASSESRSAAGGRGKSYRTEEESRGTRTERSGTGKKQKSIWGKVIPAAIAFGAIAGGVFIGVSAAGNGIINANRPTQVASANVQTSQTDSGQETGVQNAASTQTEAVSSNTDISSIAKSVMPAMVELKGTAVVSQNTFFGEQQYNAESAGTGIIIGKSDDELLILSNAHVVEDMDTLESYFIDGKSVKATVKGSNAAEDVAVVAVKLEDISEETLDAITIAQLDENDSPVIGEQVVAIGNAQGEGQSVTVGYISALDRSITIDNYTYDGLILTDAAINSGNSGGALIDAQGRVIGINFAKNGSEGVENMAYSIPIYKVKDLIESMMTQETREQVAEGETGYLGISGIDITGDMFSQYGYPQGVMIRSVENGSAAAQAGLSSYDIITAFDGKSVTTLTGLQGIMKYYKAGEEVKIDYYHMEDNEYVEKTATVTLGSRSARN